MNIYLCIMYKNKIAQYIEENRLFTLKDKIIVALSGGADSVALLRLLVDLGYTCEAAHCNFHLRSKESDRDESFVNDLCKTLNIPLHIQHFQTAKFAAEQHLSIEMAARELRYTWFETLRQKQTAGYIAVGHHKDDSVETFLLNLIRGAGINGLLGIRPINGNIVRPLLCLTRQDITTYLQGIGQSYVTDSTNLQEEYTRNKIRLNLLPQLAEINPSIKETLIHTTEYLNEVALIYKKGIEDGKKRVQTQQGILINALLNEPAPEALLFELLHPLGFNTTQTENIFKSLTGQSGKIFTSQQWIVVKDREYLLIKAIHPEIKTLIAEQPPFSYTIEEQVKGANFTIPRDPNTACFDKDKLKSSLSFRLWKQGDSFIPYGMNGRKKVSDYLTNRKFSILQKQQQWLLCSGENIAWLVGERIDDRFKIDNYTQQIIIVKIQITPSNIDIPNKLKEQLK